MYTKKRKAGDELEDTESHIADVNEQVVGVGTITTLTNRQLCFMVEPYGVEGRTELGGRELIVCEKPCEHLECGIQDVVYVVVGEEALLLRALGVFERGVGDRCIVEGACDFMSRSTLDVVCSIPVDEKESVNVCDMKSYMLKGNDELCEKRLPPIVEQLGLFNKYKCDGIAVCE